MDEKRAIDLRDDDVGALKGVLQRAVQRGDIGRVQADRILAAEAGSGFSAPRPSGSRLRSLVAEAIGYVGAALAMVAILIVISQFWADMASWSRVALPALFAVAFTFAGGFVQANDGAVARLGSFLWLLAVASAAMTAAIGGNELLDLNGESAALLIGGVAATTGAGLWWFRREFLQQVATFVGLVVMVMSGFSLLDPDLFGWSGLAVWGLGLAWGALAWADLVPPRTAGWLLAGLAALIGPTFLADEQSWALWLGLATASGVVAASIAVSSTVLLGFGVAGLFGYVPATVFEFFGDALGPPVALLITGAILIGVSIALTRVPRFRRRGHDA